MASTNAAPPLPYCTISAVTAIIKNRKKTFSRKKKRERKMFSPLKNQIVKLECFPATKRSLHLPASSFFLVMCGVTRTLGFTIRLTDGCYYTDPPPFFDPITRLKSCILRNGPTRAMTHDIPVKLALLHDHKGLKYTCDAFLFSVSTELSLGRFSGTKVGRLSCCHRQLF